MLNRPPTLFGRLKENCEDFLFGLEDEFTDMFPTTKESILADVRRTRDAARENVASARRRLQAEISEIKKDVKQEASEELDELVQQYRKFRQSISGTGTTTTPALAEDAAPVIVPTEVNYQEQIRRYESDVRSTLFITEMNKLVEESLPSPEELRAYYESRPELTEYTIKKELHRMAYTVFTHDGKKLTDPAEIEAYQATEHFPYQEGADSADSNEILWRAANQSLLGDIIVALTSRTGLIRPQLEAATFVNDLTMVLDFARDQPFAQAECFMNLSIPGSEGERLSLAGVLVNVYFCPESEKFKARISHVFPSATLCAAQVNGAARSLSPS
mmetsp:Transcript_110457/g.165304  ORF Transcript_110457/g.165304 Transcript_110457/m.165304 type:complete len:331 (-) Transcript_110457:88-1080(-)